MPCELSPCDFYIFLSDGLPETGPAGAGFEFGFGFEENGVAADAMVQAVGVVIGVFAGAGKFVSAWRVIWN